MTHFDLLILIYDLLIIVYLHLSFSKTKLEKYGAFFRLPVQLYFELTAELSDCLMQWKLTSKLNFHCEVFHDFNGELILAEVGRIGIGICYDIRFQELAMIYAARGWFVIFSLSISVHLAGSNQSCPAAQLGSPRSYIYILSSLLLVSI